MSEFDKKIDSIEKLAKEAKKFAENLTGNPFSELEKIAKDIVEKQDNAKAMEFTKNIGTLLKENGVTPILTEYRNETTTDNSYKCQCVYAVESLDFTEHDKVFEDKIDRLEKSYHRHRSEICKLESENQSLKNQINELENIINNKLGCWDKHGISYQEILDMKDENESLKKRIEELETELEVKKTKIEIPLTPIEVANYLINHTTHADAVLFLPKRNVNTFDVSELEQIAEHLLVYCKHNKEVEE